MCPRAVIFLWVLLAAAAGAGDSGDDLFAGYGYYDYSEAAAPGAGDSADEDNYGYYEDYDYGGRDPCDYNEHNVRCGDQCISGLYAFCKCGNETIRPRNDDQHCCLPPGGTCTTKPWIHGTN